MYDSILHANYPTKVFVYFLIIIISYLNNVTWKLYVNLLARELQSLPKINKLKEVITQES